MRALPRSYQEKVVWITGASSGIGASLAEAFAKRDANLVLSARRQDRLDAVRARCVHSERHRVVPLDLTDSAAIPVVAEAVLSQVGRVDVLVNNGTLPEAGRRAVRSRCSSSNAPLTATRRCRSAPRRRSAAATSRSVR